MVGDPGCKVREDVPLRSLSCELSTELRLPPGTLDE
jgi:hypothetical protein